MFSRAIISIKYLFVLYSKFIERRIMSDSVLLTEVSRGNSFESAHRGWVAVCDEKGNLINGTHKSFPDIFVRSTIKPIQALPFLMSGGMETFNFGLSELAVICSSHSGEQKHLERVKYILDTIGLKPENLLCGTHTPYSPKVAKQLIEERQEPTLLHCNCSGKHAGMLAACLLNGWDLNTYLEYNHPIQIETRKYLSLLTSLEADKLVWAIDGCGIPTYKFSLDKLARIFSFINNYENAPIELYDSLKMINKAFIAHPDLVSGEDRIDSIIMHTQRGRFISKIGGEAVLGFGLINEKKSFALKIEDGINRPIIPVIVRTLELLGVDINSIPELKELETCTIKNNKGEDVGLVKPVFDFIT